MWSLFNRETTQAKVERYLRHLQIEVPPYHKPTKSFRIERSIDGDPEIDYTIHIYFGNNVIRFESAFMYAPSDIEITGGSLSNLRKADLLKKIRSIRKNFKEQQKFLKTVLAKNENILPLSIGVVAFDETQKLMVMSALPIDQLTLQSIDYILTAFENFYTDTFVDLVEAVEDGDIELKGEYLDDLNN